VALRILLDEHVWNGLVAVGRQIGVDVLPVQQVLPKGTSDEEVLEFAASEERVLLTSNARDFGPLAADWFQREKSHAGIIIVPGRTDRRLLSKALATMSQGQTYHIYRNTYRFVQELIKD